MNINTTSGEDPISSTKTLHRFDGQTVTYHSILGLLEMTRLLIPRFGVPLRERVMQTQYGLPLLTSRRFILIEIE